MWFLRIENRSQQVTELVWIQIIKDAKPRVKDWVSSDHEPNIYSRFIKHESRTQITQVDRSTFVSPILTIKLNT